MNTYSCTFCNKSFKRYKGSVRNPKKVYCSVKCKSEHQKEFISGINNPNYRNGSTLDTFCDCGNTKDYRASKCSKCSNVGFGIKSGSKEDREQQLLKLTIENVNSTKSILELAKIVNSSRKTVAQILLKNNIDLSHFRPANNRPFSFEKIFCINKRMNQTVKRAILFYNLLEYKCCICGLEKEWQNKELKLELDHINGDCCDNRVENLRFLCPNCHSQTSTSKGKNAKHKPKQKRKRK